MSGIHATAIVESGAELDPTVEIGAYAVVGPHVRLGPGVVLRPHAIVTGHTQIGAETVVHSFACLGEQPQVLRYGGEKTHLVIGERNTIREYVSIHPGTAEGGGTTSVGDDNLLMIGMHVGHDCQLGSQLVISNNTQLAGHVIIEDWAWISANSAVQQFVRIGETAFLAGMSGAMQDIAPFSWAQGHPARVLRPNKVGMERRQFDKAQIDALDRAFRILFRSRQRPEVAFAQVRRDLPDSAEAERMVAFLEKSERGFARLR
jgi:UDP-N-acetylglucosamine acyltransferase